MEEQFKQLKNLKHLRLSEEEKGALRIKLVHFMRTFTPAPKFSLGPFSIRSPFIVRPIAFGMIALLVVCGGGVGLTYASNDALPGNFLYGLKVNVVEEAGGLLIKDPVERATYEVERAARRLEETAQLALTGRLDHEKETIIRSQLAKHAERVTMETNKIKQAATPEKEIEVAGKLETEFAARTAVLREIKEAKNINGELGSILAVAEETVTKAKLDQTSLAQQLSNSPEKITRANVLDKQEDVEKQLVVLQKLIEQSNREAEEEILTLQQELSGITLEETAVKVTKMQGDISLTQATVSTTTGAEIDLDEEQVVTASSLTTKDPAMIEATVEAVRALETALTTTDLHLRRSEYTEAFLVLEEAEQKAKEVLTMLTLKQSYNFSPYVELATNTSEHILKEELREIGETISAVSTPSQDTPIEKPLLPVESR